MAALAELGGVQPASGLVSRVEEGQFTPKTSNRALEVDRSKHNRNQLGVK